MLNGKGVKMFKETGQKYERYRIVERTHKVTLTASMTARCRTGMSGVICGVCDDSYIIIIDQGWGRGDLDAILGLRVNSGGYVYVQKRDCTPPVPIQVACRMRDYSGKTSTASTPP